MPLPSFDPVIIGTLTTPSTRILRHCPVLLPSKRIFTTKKCEMLDLTKNLQENRSLFNSSFRSSFFESCRNSGFELFRKVFFEPEFFFNFSSQSKTKRQKNWTGLNFEAFEAKKWCTADEDGPGSVALSVEVVLLNLNTILTIIFFGIWAFPSLFFSFSFFSW